MNIVADLHTHTLACGHAYSTLTEVIQEASDKGIKSCWSNRAWSWISWKCKMGIF